MNINTTINLDDILNSNEEASSEETIEILKESIAETAKSIEENAPLPDFDAIVTEWSYRCDKGYPDMKNKSDMIKLQEILNEMGIKSPFKQIEEEIVAEKKATKKASYKTETPLEDKFMSLIEGTFDPNIQPKIPSAVKPQLLAVFKANKSKQKTWIAQFQKMEKVEDFIKADGNPWQEFFNCEVKGMGRGEMMAVMAIQGARSGGTKEKDLIINETEIWEVKEDPTGIRMAQSGFAGRFRYINELRKFYELLNTINLNDYKNDNELKKQLLSVFGKEDQVNKMFKILTTNFRGDGYKISKKDQLAAEEDGTALITKANFFDRMIVAAEYPTGVIDLHYDGFKQLKELRTDIITQKQLVNNAKLIIQTAGSDEDSKFYINAKDADNIKTAGKKGAQVNIKVAAPVKGSTVEFLHAMLQIVRHPFVKAPDEIVQDFIERKSDYFSKIKGFVYYESEDPTPKLGKAKDFVIYGISQAQGKIEHKQYISADPKPFLKAQLK